MSAPSNLCAPPPERLARALALVEAMRHDLTAENRLRRLCAELRHEGGPAALEAAGVLTLLAFSLEAAS